LVFVAAGVGVTPLMSILRYMRDRRETRRVLFVYANREAGDIVFRGELASVMVRDAVSRASVALPTAVASCRPAAGR
jgi:ferredoxin-NADP reductase